MKSVSILLKDYEFPDILWIFENIEFILNNEIITKIYCDFKEDFYDE